MTYAKKATGRFDVTAWQEETFVDVDGSGTTAGDAYYPDRGLSRAQVAYRYTGDLEGTSTAVLLIAYKADAAPVLGLEQFTGSVDGHEGSCVFRQVGEQDKGSVSTRLEVVPGLGTGGLEHLRGEAELRIAGHSDDGYELVLSYDLD
ncbi:MAG: DUF3224 domain-containing protein [Nocardioidaceae bacterium]|nr:DUF3224 domain-containing protein [Nocardioidaceae bacterium]NUS50253.1 DUF3224 domain-containing protein [Nocardioidaceae bacterium]